MQSYQKFIANLPKAELHIHLEGTLEKDLFYTLAERNNIKLEYATIESVQQATGLSCQQAFYQAFFHNTQVLKTEKDFYEVMAAYLKKAAAQKVLYAEVTFDIQTYMHRIKPETIINGLYAASIDMQKKYGIRSNLIHCFLRTQSEHSAFDAFSLIRPYKDKILGINLAGYELASMPQTFKKIFDDAKKEGYFLVAHAGEYASSVYIEQAIYDLKVDRIDHGLSILENDFLVEQCIVQQIPITVCPISNVRLGIIKSLGEHPFKKMFDAKLLISLNSDDPVFFGSYINDVYLKTAEEFLLSEADLVFLAKNSFDSAFISSAEKQYYKNLVENYS